ncbi:uncharacterized protein LOC113326009 [Papaver somniferum]|uniref:uncharacterized protein LOC113326009 n=1 Tax=Papaver somniferum TaxID=3469 RepID=UPI000E7023F0|nr:uncharacterized protein LOC113326009 [Papaver somniferum]
MKIFGWMQSKLNGKQTIATKKPTNVVSTKSQNLHEEFSDWPNALLAIGTFGTKDSLKRDNEIMVHDAQEDVQEQEITSSSVEEDQLDFTPEEVGKLQKELTKLLSRKPVEQTESQRRNGISTLPLDKFLNCPSSLEVDRTICNELSVADDNKDVIADLRRSISVVLGSKPKDVCFDGNNNGAIKKKSISFLLKKMFVCSSGFAPVAPSLRGQMQLPESRMEKLLRAILNKEIHQKGSNAATSNKKYLENNNSRHISANIQMELESEFAETESHGSSKWDKTDSEFIVLEI